GVGVLNGHGQHADGLSCGQDDKVNLATSGVLLDLLHHRQRAVGTGANHKSATSPRDVLRDRERGVPVRAAEPLGRGLLAFADLSAVDDQVVIVGHAVDAYRTEREPGESHADVPCLHGDRMPVPATGPDPSDRAVVRARLTRSAVGRLASDLGDAPVPGALGAVLAKVTNDPGVEVAYWLPESGRFVDGSGKTVPEAAPGGGKTVTRIRREGRLVAIVRHDRAVADTDRLERAIGAAARLAVDNERLRAGVLAQLEDLRASRARIVEAGDAERRRLERDLHDSAQQRLLALSYELRIARGAAAAGDPQL